MMAPLNNIDSVISMGVSSNFVLMVFLPVNRTSFSPTGAYRATLFSILDLTTLQVKRFNQEILHEYVFAVRDDPLTFWS